MYEYCALITRKPYFLYPLSLQALAPVQQKPLRSSHNADSESLHESTFCYKIRSLNLLTSQTVGFNVCNVKLQVTSLPVTTILKRLSVYRPMSLSTFLWIAVSHKIWILVVSTHGGISASLQPDFLGHSSSSLFSTLTRCSALMMINQERVRLLSMTFPRANKTAPIILGLLFELPSGTSRSSVFILLRQFCLLVSLVVLRHNFLLQLLPMMSTFSTPLATGGFSVFILPPQHKSECALVQMTPAVVYRLLRGVLVLF